MCPRWDEKLGINILNAHFFFPDLNIPGIMTDQASLLQKSFPAMNQVSVMAHFVGLLVVWKQSVENEFRR